MRHTAAGALLLLCLGTGPLFPELRTPPPAQNVSVRPLPIEASDRDPWEARRGELLKQWQEILGPFPQRVPLDARVVSSEELEDHTRVLIEYQSDADTRNDAYLLLPRGARAPMPGAVTLHPTSKTSLRDPVGLANRESVHFALHLVRRGYVCVAPRNFLWAVEGQSFQQAAERVLKEGKWKTGMAKMVWEAMRATDLLLERPEVDAGRIASIGHSLGGKEALYHAAFDPRISAAISCEGGVGLSFSNWEADWYLGKQIASPAFAHDNHEVMALIAPRGLLVIGGESADGARSWPFVQAVLGVWRMYDAVDRIGLLRHDQKHNFPSPGPQRELAYRWLDHCLNRD